MSNTEKLQHARSWSEGWMRVFLETAVDAIMIIDSNGLIESFNPAAERIFGYRDVDVVGMNVNMLMPAPYASEHDGYLANFLRTGNKKIIGIGREVVARRKDGADFPIHLSVAELELDGETRFTGIIRDLTEEKEVRAREQDTTRILEKSLNEIFIFDAATLRFIQVNDGARSNLGYSMEELVELTPVDIKPDFTESAFETLVQPLRAGEQARIRFTTTHLRKDGSTYPVEVHLELGTYAGRRAFVAIILDVTDRDQLQKELLHAQKLEAIGQLAGSLAHDFNNLLMGVMSGCRMVAQMVEHDEAAKDLLAEIQKEAYSGASITRQLLDFSRKRSYETVPFSLGAIARKKENFFRQLLGEDVDLQVSADEQGSTIQADPDKLEQVLVNLVLNARDAMPTGGQLTISVSCVNVPAKTRELESGPHVLLSVCDTGCGMNKETQARVFEPFYTTKAVGKGTGLGLSTVFGLTAEFGGHVDLKSAPGEGTEFRLYFPQVAAQATTMEERTPNSPRGTATILVVEDVSLVRAGIRNLLEGLGYTVLVAPDPKAALEILETGIGVDLLLTDIVMPGMSGTELARLAKADYPSMSVLFMSAFSDEALIEQGRIQSGTSVLEKPFEEDVLAMRVRAAIERG